jgi:serine/threonine-protein kinase
MKFSADQLAILSSLSDQWLDLPDAHRERWRDAAIRKHPELALAIAGIADDSSVSSVSPQLKLTNIEVDNDTPEFFKGGTIGTYRLVREIGRGGMGVVWLADQDNEHITRTVALKLPLQHLPQKGLRTRFARERNILAALDHPGIAKMFDAGIAEDGQPYMAMQYVSGVAITSHCDQQQLDVPTRLRLFIELLDAVQYAHSNLIVHRDIKPGNILVTTEGRVMLLDFGIAKLLDSQASTDPTGNGKSMTEFAGTALTLDYASPEQVAEQAVSTRTDIYSLGVVLYELLVGRRPYHLRRASRAALEEAVLAQEISSPSSKVDDASATRCRSSRHQLTKTLRGDLDAIVLKALGKNPESRYATAQSFADDLCRWLDGRPVAAQVPSRWYLTRRYLKRHRWAVASVALTVVGLAGGLGAALWQAGVAREEARVARTTEVFLTRLFEANSVRQTDPARTQQMTVRELLDLGAQRVMTQLDEIPEVRLRLLSTLADLYQEMLVMEPALKLRQEMAQLRQKLHPGPTRERASDLIQLAGNGNMLLPRTETTAYLAQARQILDALGDQDSELRGHLEVQQAQQVMADRRQGAAYAARAVTILRPHGPTELFTDALVTLAVCQAEVGDPAQALATAQEALALTDRLQLETGRATIQSVIARSQGRLGQIEASIASARLGLQGVSRLRAADAPPNAAELGAATTLAGMLVDGAQPKAAWSTVDEVLKAALRDEGDLDRYGLRMRVARLLGLRGKLSIDIGDSAAGVRDLERAGELMAHTPAAEGQKSQYLDRVAVGLISQGRLGEAQCRLDEARAMHLRLQHAGTAQFNEHLVNQVRLLMAAGRGEQALPLLNVLQADPAVGGMRSRTDLEREVLGAEVLASVRRWPDALRQSQEIALTIELRPAQQFWADLKARADVVTGAARLGIGEPGAALTPLTAAT